MLLDKLLVVLDTIDKKNYVENTNIEGIAYHSASVEKGYIYVAIKGYVTDGHKYAKSAVESGAIAIIVEEFVEGLEIPQIKVSNSREALSMISAEYYNNSSKDMKIIGVTATNGKTTTTYMLNHIYENAGFKTGLIGSVMNKFGDTIIASYLTTPESLDLQFLFSEMKKNNIEKVPMEVSSSALELFRVNDVDFDIVSFNNFSREHIDQHGSFEKYWEAKSSLIRKAKKGSFAILNIDDEHIKSLISQTQAHVITYSIKAWDGDIYCKDLELLKGRAKFKVVITKDIDVFPNTIKKGEIEISLGIPGLHSVENAMVAIVIALTDGISVELIQDSMNEFMGVERRFEYVYEKEYLIIDDHFANLKNIDVSLETLSHMDHNDLHLIYAVRGNRGVTVNKENAEAVVSWKEKLNIKEIIGTKSIGHVGVKDTVKDEEEKAFKDIITSSGINLIMYDRLEDAIEHSLKSTKEHDIVLLAGCQGMDMGAKIALDYIHSIRPEIDEKQLYKPILKRAAEQNI